MSKLILIISCKGKQHLFQVKGGLRIEIFKSSAQPGCGVQGAHHQRQGLREKNGKAADGVLNVEDCTGLMQATLTGHAMDSSVSMPMQVYNEGQKARIFVHASRQIYQCYPKRCSASSNRRFLIQVLIMMLLFTLPSRSFSVSYGYLVIGFTGSAMAYVDTDGDFLYSPSSTFTLSFFSSIDQVLFYLCIIHTASREIVWTANRDTPLSQSDQLVFSLDGNAALIHGNRSSSTAWSTNTAGLGANRMYMLDSGNLVLLNASNATVWQSFDYPTDTLLNGQVLSPGMRLTGSIAEGNMSAGPFSLAMMTGDLRLSFSPSSALAQVYWSMLQAVQLVLPGRGTPTHVRLDSTGLSLLGADGVVISSISLPSNAAVCKATLHSDGNLGIYVYSLRVWTMQFTALQGGCALPLHCGSFGICRFGQCSCPSPLQALNANNIAQGCLGLAKPSCTNSSGSHFEEVGDGLEYFANSYTSPAAAGLKLDSCKNLCMQNCSCSSFFFNNETGSCFLYTQLGTIQSTGKGGHMLYVKTDQIFGSPSMELNASRIASPPSHGLPSFVLPLILSGSSLLVLALACLFIYWFLKMHKVHFFKDGRDNQEDDEIFLEAITGLPTRFTLKELQNATNNFSKKLGEGGFGSVYEGSLPDKSKVAVKRLEGVGAGQGTKEFRAEVAIIGRIHHVHLVQLCGFCVEGSHRLLVYEFLANGSLDKFLFGEENKVLDWSTRFQVALGTARGLAYLHDECREKIIHCDIKPENILLDENYNAKVSDFGLAKLISKEQSQVFTTMRGTRGYLAPEWIMNLAISEKSDVYSFGMVLLEIVSGRKNLELTAVSEKRYFPLYAFEQTEKESTVKLVDERLKEDVCEDEVIRAVKVALWCIQEDISARPSMSKVVQMLEGNLKIVNPPLSTQFSGKGHVNMIEAIDSAGRSSSSSNFTRSHGQSAVQLSEAR